MSIDIDSLITYEVVVPTLESVTISYTVTVPTSESSVINDGAKVLPFNWLLATESENYVLTESGDSIIV